MKINTEEKYIYYAIIIMVILAILKITIIPDIPWWIATITLWLPFAFISTVIVCLFAFIILSIFFKKDNSIDEH